MRQVIKLKAFVLISILIGFQSPLLFAGADDGLFKPGTVSEQYDLNPPEQNDDPNSSQFLVERDMKLYKFENGLTSGKARPKVRSPSFK